MAKGKHLYLVDGSSHLYRAYHAMPSLTNSQGQPTGATYGVVNMLRKLINEHQPAHLAIVFDAKGKTFRNDLYSEYKANRPPMPGDLAAQIEDIHQMVEAMGLPLLVIPGVEADDVIGTLSTQAADQGFRVSIISGDKDFAQLVSSQIELVDTMKGVSYGVEGVREKFGVNPQQIIDYLALMGDSADNVPGVPKVGPKTAAKWLEQYHSLDRIMDAADEMGGKVGQNLRDSLETLPLSKELVTIRCDVGLDVEPIGLKRLPEDSESLKALFSRLDFRPWLEELGGSDRKDEGEPVEADYETILDLEAFNTWFKALSEAALFAFDTETTELNAINAEIVGLSFAIEAGKAAYLPLAHSYLGVPKQLDRQEILERLKPLLEDPERGKVGQNLKYDRQVLLNYGIDLKGVRFDTMLESYLLDSTATRHDMDSLALKHLGRKTIKFEEVAGKGKNQISFDQVHLEEATPYAAEDADITLQLHHHLWPKLEAEPSLERLFHQIELPLFEVLARIERNGVTIDALMLKRQSEELAKGLNEVESKSYELAGGPFNLGSPKQLGEILFDRLEIPILRKTPKGKPSTAEDVLEELAQSHELPRQVLRHRSLSKLKSTYTDKLPLLVNPRTGRVHTSLHQAVAATGRLSSSDPNLQNIPIRTPEGRRIREAFVPVSGALILSADYSQIELRIMAHLSQDPGLLSAFNQGKDVHRATAAEVFGAPLEAVSEEQRRSAKAINFGLIYGMSAFGLARQLNIPRHEAHSYIELYFERYPGVRAYMERTKEEAREKGFVETLFGRRLYLPEIRASNAARRQYAERTAINAPMQGTAADLIKLAMLAVDRWIGESAPSAKMILQVHDELILEVAEEDAERASHEVVALMEGIARLKVPLTVDVGMGLNWLAAHS